MSTTHVIVKKAIISSTARDLPDHRKQVMDACQRQTFFPLMMEHLPASDAEAISASLALVDQADVYIGAFAYRFGLENAKKHLKELGALEPEMPKTDST